jgi:hypothetical protein
MLLLAAADDMHELLMQSVLQLLPAYGCCACGAVVLEATAAFPCFSHG